MTKAELIKAIAAETGATQTSTSSTVDAILRVITEALANGDEINLVGFGKFSVAERAARIGRNPQTGDEIKIDAKKAPKFKPSSALKNALND